MSKTLLDLKIEAQNRLLSHNITGAFKVYRLLLESVPLDFELRFEVADIFYALGSSKNAAAVYQAIAEHYIKAGEPLGALVAVKILEQQGIMVKPALQLLVKTYAAGSPKLGRSIRPAPIDYSQPVREDINLDYQMDDSTVAATLAQMAAFTRNIEKYPQVVPPISILSTLDENSFAQLLNLLTLRRLKDGECIIKEGDQGYSLFFVARGQVKITKHADNSGQSEFQLAKLGPGSIFGEMALISEDPRGASVFADGAADIFELTKDQVDELSKTIPNVAGAMARFTRERMISNLLATNPLFSPFDEASKKQLLTRFAGHEVPPGTIFIEQGKPGTGLYLILQGQSEVLSWNGTEYIKVADLKPGDIAGEISLIYDEDATATVRTVSRSTLLFLARELFKPLVEAYPELLKYFAKMANARVADTGEKLEAEKIASGDGIENVDESDDDTDIDELSGDDLIMI